MAQVMDYDDSTTSSDDVLDEFILQNDPAFARSVAQGRRDQEARAANPPDCANWEHVMAQSRRMDYQQLPTDNYRP